MVVQARFTSRLSDKVQMLFREASSARSRRTRSCSSVAQSVLKVRGRNEGYLSYPRLLVVVLDGRPPARVRCWANYMYSVQHGTVYL